MGFMQPTASSGLSKANFEIFKLVTNGATVIGFKRLKANAYYSITFIDIKATGSSTASALAYMPYSRRLYLFEADFLSRTIQ